MAYVKVFFIHIFSGGCINCAVTPAFLFFFTHHLLKITSHLAKNDVTSYIVYYTIYLFHVLTEVEFL